jgi:hypothetical protein
MYLFGILVSPLLGPLVVEDAIEANKRVMEIERCIIGTWRLEMRKRVCRVGLSTEWMMCDTFGNYMLPMSLKDFYRLAQHACISPAKRIDKLCR